MGGGKGVFLEQMEEKFINEWNSNPIHEHKIVRVKLFRTGSLTMPDDIRRQLPDDFFKPDHAMIGDNISKDDLKPCNGKKKIRIW